MEFTELTLRLLYIFFPGIIITIFYDKLTFQSQKSPFFFIIYSFVFGMLSYLIVGALYFYFFTGEFFIFPLIYDISDPINKTPIIWATIVSFPLIVFLSYISKYKVIYNFARLIKCSDKTGYLSIWEEFFSQKEIEWVTVKDYKNNKMYQGWVYSYSIVEEERELFLKDVLIYEGCSGIKITSEPLSSMLLYVPQSKDIVIQVY